MNIPDNATKYILLQRTGHTKLQRNFIIKFVRKLLPEEYRYTKLVDLETLIRKESIKKNYIKDMETEFKDIVNYLPSKATNILDIGCGIGGINVLLFKHYGAPDTAFYCLDKTQTDNIYYGFKEKGAYYNSLEITRDFLLLNGIRNVHMMSANDSNTIETPEIFDLIFSLISWGFHYPVETYLAQAYDHLHMGGHLIMDIRKDTNGLDAVRGKFMTTKLISETNKKVRILATKH